LPQTGDTGHLRGAINPSLPPGAICRPQGRGPLCPLVLFRCCSQGWRGAGQGPAGAMRGAGGGRGRTPLTPPPKPWGCRALRDAPELCGAAPRVGPARGLSVCPPPPPCIAHPRCGAKRDGKITSHPISRPFSLCPRPRSAAPNRSFCKVFFFFKSCFVLNE